MTNSLRHEFNTSKDKKILFNLIDREIGYKTKPTFDIQKIINRENTECNQCNSKADYRIVKDQYKTYSEHICHTCLEEKTGEWLQTQLNQLKQNLDRYKTAEQL